MAGRGVALGSGLAALVGFSIAGSVNCRPRGVKAPASQSQAAPAESWIEVERASFDWAGDGQPCDLIAERLAEPQGGGAYHRVSIRKAGRLLATFEDRDGLDSVAECLGPEGGRLAQGNLLKSKLFLAPAGVVSPAGRPVVLFFGYAYASSPGSFRVLVLGPQGIPVEALGLENFQLEAFLGAKGGFVGTVAMAEECGPGLQTYNPFRAFTWGRGSDLRLDEAASRAYNLEHGPGWAGLAHIEDYRVVLHPPEGGPAVVLPAAQAEALRVRKP